MCHGLKAYAMGRTAYSAVQKSQAPHDTEADVPIVAQVTLVSPLPSSGLGHEKRDRLECAEPVDALRRLKLSRAGSQRRIDRLARAGAVLSGDEDARRVT